jgi:hypothetical protein
MEEEEEDTKLLSQLQPVPNSETHIDMILSFPSQPPKMMLCFLH